MPAEKQAGEDEGSQYLAEEVILDPEVDPAVQTTAITKAARYATHGLIAGALIVLVGAILIVLGFSGSVDITFQNDHARGHLTTGSLGVVVVLVGGAIVMVTRYRVKIIKGEGP